MKREEKETAKNLIGKTCYCDELDEIRRKTIEDSGNGTHQAKSLKSSKMVDN